MLIYRQDLTKEEEEEGEEKEEEEYYSVQCPNPNYIKYTSQ